MQPKIPQCLLQGASPQNSSEPERCWTQDPSHTLCILIHITFYSVEMCRRSQHIINHIRHILCIVLKHAHTKNFHHFKICLFPSRQIFPPSTYLDHLEILQCLVPMKTDGIGGYQLVETWKIRRLPWGKATNGPEKKTPFQIHDVVGKEGIECTF